MRARPMFRRGLLGGCFCMRVHVLQPQGKCVPVCVPADASNQSVKKFVRAQAHGRLPLSLPVCLYCLQPVNKSCSYSHILMLIQSCTRLCTIIFLYLHLLIQSCTRLCTIISLCLHLLIQIMHSSLHNHILVFAFAHTFMHSSLHNHILVFAFAYTIMHLSLHNHILVFAFAYTDHALVFAQSYSCICIAYILSSPHARTLLHLCLCFLQPVKRLLATQFPNMKMLETSSLHKGIAGSKHEFVSLQAGRDKLDLLSEVRASEPCSHCTNEFVSLQASRDKLDLLSEVRASEPCSHCTNPAHTTRWLLLTCLVLSVSVSLTNRLVVAAGWKKALILACT